MNFSKRFPELGQFIFAGQGYFNKTHSLKIWAILFQVVGRSRYPSLEDRVHLNYMNAVLHESLRVASLFGPGMPHYSTNDIPVGDFIIPKKTLIFGSLYHVMNDPEHFPDPHRFDPERFLKDGRFGASDRVVPFGIGKRACLGQSLAEKQFYIFFAGILQQFELCRDENSKLPAYNADELFPATLLNSVPTFSLKLRRRT